MKKIISGITLTVSLLVLSQAASAEWLFSRTVNKLGAYQHSTAHFVWLSGGVGGCVYAQPMNPTLVYNEASPGGKSLTEILTTAVVNRRIVDVQIQGCDIIEVYLR